MRRAIAALALTLLCVSAAARAADPYAPGADPVVSLEGYRRVLADAALDPKLDLFTLRVKCEEYRPSRPTCKCFE